MIDPIIIGLIGLGGVIALIILRFPIAYAMILTGILGISTLSGPQVVLAQLKTLPYGQFSIYDLSVIPLFILMGALAVKTGLTRDLFRAAHAWLGGVRGGTAMAAITACAGFGAVCGSSLATTSAMGKTALPELRRYDYAPALATGAVAAGGVLGILIPPSIVLVIYAMIVEANVVTLFMAALIPGLLAVILFLLNVAIYVRLFPAAAPAPSQTTRAELYTATRRVIPVLVVFAGVIGGIYAGLYTPTPAAAVGVFLVCIFGVFRNQLSLPKMALALKETAATTGMIFLILLGAEIFKIFMSRAGIPQFAADWALQSGLTPMAVLLMLLLVLIVLGCLMDSLSMILLVVPFFWPVLVTMNGGDFQAAEGAGYAMSTEDLKIWFGILALVVVELGLITPPVGLNVVVISSLARDVPITTIFKGITPFFLAEIIRIGVLIAFPLLILGGPMILGN
jgi:tripartite ATP-independent transporter DctM subunit